MDNLTREDCAKLDREDPVSEFRDEFVLPENTIYLDGNSLGALPRTTIHQMEKTVQKDWGMGLIRSWNEAEWITMPQRLGDKIAPLIGAKPGEVVVVDSTSINLFKVLVAALRLKKDRNVIVSEQENFPSDLYISEGVMEIIGGTYERRLLPEGDDAIEELIDETVAVVMLCHVNYKNGHIHDMRRVTQAAHSKGALVIWDLSHGTGVIPIDLNGTDSDFAVGCGYKYLNGGPGAPAYLYVKEALLKEVTQPLTGWLGHTDPFAFDTEYKPADDISKFICGTPPILSYAAVESGLEIFERASIEAIREKGKRLTNLFIRLMEQECDSFGFKLLSPRDSERRGCQVAYAHSDGFPIVQALVARGVIGDFREPNIVRFGFTPLYIRYIDVWETVTRLSAIMESGEWKRPEFQERGIVT